MSIKLLINKNKKVDWSLSQSLYVIKNYNLIPVKQYRISKTEKQINKKIGKIKLTSIKKNTHNQQKKVNDKIYNYIVKITEYYNENKRLPKYLNKINKKYINIIENAFPKCYFKQMKKETQVLNFIDKYKRLPNNKGNSAERKLFTFLNMAQYNKKNKRFMKELEKVKQKHSIRIRVGEKRNSAEFRMKDLLNFIEKHKRLPKINAKNKYEKKLRSFFGSVCLPNGFNVNPKLTKPHIPLFLKLMKSQSGYRHYNIKFYQDVVDGKIIWR